MDAPVPAPAPKSSSPIRWILLGCGLVTLLGILGAGGLAGIFYLVYKGSEDTAKIGEAYLRSAPELRNAIDEHASVERNWMGWNVSVVNDGGNANFTYTIQHDDGRPTEARVWLIRSAGRWRAVGARVRPPAGERIEIGRPPEEHHRSDWD
ncbi:MAG TPA: hypothetical protein VM222_04010 [Planctomycetota bacterium]|nr:hypothetical protein [Planctomycetota bacterium]